MSPEPEEAPVTKGANRVIENGWYRDAASDPPHVVSGVHHHPPSPTQFCHARPIVSGSR
jgi:hypothetical protein